jgi:glycosyltransferase involved in cell wall biosynthesis
MKILQVCSATEIGGGERHVIDLTRALIERGHELHLAIRSNAKIKSELSSLPIIWHELPLKNAVDIFSAKKLKKIIVQHNIEIVHGHVARDYTVCGLACKKTSAKLFLTRHHFNPIKSNFLYRWALRDTYRLIAVSSAVNSFERLQEKICVIPNWIDLASIATLTKGDARKSLDITHKFAVAIIGQISPGKGQSALIAAAAYLSLEPVGREIDYLIIGAAKKTELEYELFLKEGVNCSNAQASYGTQVHFKGYISDIVTKLAAFDIIAVPSISEGFSLVTTEAMAAGCAIIASNAGALSELIEHEVSGLLIEPGNGHELAFAIKRLLFDEKLRLQLVTQARIIARAKFERESVISQIENLYRKKIIDRL